MRGYCVLLALLAPVTPSPAQHRVDPRNTYQRLLVVCPVVGAGTWADPKRPALAPPPSVMKPGDRSGIIGWHYELSDDGKSALVELIAARRSALTSAINVNVPGITVLDPGKQSRKDIEKALKALKKDFDLDKFAGRAQ